MVGVYFDGHRSLQRLLTDYSFKGHPLRRDFPVVGYVECFYTYHLNLVEFVKSEYMQECRVFEFYDNWDESDVNDNISTFYDGPEGPCVSSAAPREDTLSDVFTEEDYMGD